MVGGSDFWSKKTKWKNDFMKTSGNPDKIRVLEVASKPFGSSKKEPMVDTISTIGSLFFSRKALYIKGFFFLC